MTVLCVAFSLPSAAEQSRQTQLTTGFRIGDQTLESFADFLVPLYDQNGNTLLFNPRFSHKDEGELEGNLGLVWRRLVKPEVIMGVNGYVDSRRSQFGNRFNQAGVGVEVLGKWIDARFNWYDADSSPKVASESTIQEVSSSTLTQSSTSISSRTDFKMPGPRGNAIVQDYVTTQESTTTVTNIRTTTTTDRVFQKFEAGLDGYDAEVGARFPTKKGMPDLRLFAGMYDFNGGFGHQAKGYKARLEIKSGPYLTFDVEVFRRRLP